MNDIGFFVITIPIILLALTIHEYAHAKVADLLGDPTPRLAGRLTLNPISHIDPIGFLMLIIARFGWAKPVPVNPYNFRNPGRDNMFVSLAGPFTNFFAAWILAVILRNSPVTYGSMTAEILSYAIFINLALGVFNLIPIPPLDGSHVLEALLPYRYKEAFYRLQSYSLFLLLFIVLFGGPVLFMIIEFLYRLLV